MWYIYTREYYSAIKSKDIMNFAGKWMQLGNIIVSEATKTQYTHATLHRSKEAKQEGSPK